MSIGNQLESARIEDPSHNAFAVPGTSTRRGREIAGGSDAPLTFTRLGDVAEWLTRGPAKPFTPVRFRSSPLGEYRVFSGPLGTAVGSASP